MARPERRLEVTDSEVLAALAHPLRVALLYQLNALGSRTASQGLVAAARAAGAAAAADGLGMLCAQAAGAVVKIARVRPDLAAMAAAVGLAWPEQPGGGSTSVPT